MKFLRYGLALAALASLPSMASAAQSPPTDPYTPNLYFEGVADATAAQTFNTTSYADVALATVTMPALTQDYSGDYAWVCYTADAIKATSTTGTIAVYANGAVVAKTAQTVDTAAKNTNLGGCWTIAVANGNANVVKLQAKSGDTAVFTINNAELTVWRLRIN